MKISITCANANGKLFCAVGDVSGMPLSVLRGVVEVEIVDEKEPSSGVRFFPEYPGALTAHSDIRREPSPVREQSCTFMAIAKQYGVDYGDVLLATEAYRPENMFRVVDYSDRWFAIETAFVRIGIRAGVEVRLACQSRWGA